MISYTPLPIPLPDDPSRGLSLPRRDLFDARFQLISTEEQGEDEDENEPTLIDFLDAPSDLIPGVYEGGLKTWECSVDLAAHLASVVSSKPADWIRGKTILEVGRFIFLKTLSDTNLSLLGWMWDGHSFSISPSRVIPKFPSTG